MRLIIDMKRIPKQVLKELKQEIEATLLFFIQTDLEIYGFVTENTKEAFKTQGGILPKELDIQY